MPLWAEAGTHDVYVVGGAGVEAGGARVGAANKVTIRVYPVIPLWHVVAELADEGEEAIVLDDGAVVVDKGDVVQGAILVAEGVGVESGAPLGRGVRQASGWARALPSKPGTCAVNDHGGSG